MGSRKSYQKPKGQNPALAHEQTKILIKKHLDDARQSGIEFASVSLMIIFCHVLNDKARIPDEEVVRLIKEIEKASDMITEGYYTIPDVIKLLREENHMDLTIEKLLEYYPQLEGYLSNEDDKKE